MGNIKIGLLIAGIKGLNFLKAFCPIEKPVFVASYPFKGLQCQPVDEIQQYCNDNNYPYFDSKDINQSLIENVDLMFVAGWQFLLDYPVKKLVVLHDSLLPKFRGFTPTVNALICGENKIGVTAFEPVQEIDAGPIYDQIAIDISYPIKIKEAYAILGQSYADCAHNVVKKLRCGQLKSQPQDEEQASYSIWRGETDLLIDWNQDNYTISRFVDALGWPYPGARTFYKGQAIIIDEVKISKEKNFEIHQPGKIWGLYANKPEILCGKGTLQILSARTVEGQKVHFDKLREQLGVTP